MKLPFVVTRSAHERLERERARWQESQRQWAAECARTRGLLERVEALNLVSCVECGAVYDSRAKELKTKCRTCGRDLPT